jgi:hypothetical protein
MILASHNFLFLPDGPGHGLRTESFPACSAATTLPAAMERVIDAKVAENLKCGIGPHPWHRCRSSGQLALF